MVDGGFDPGVWPSPTSRTFDDLVEFLVSGLAERGVRVRPQHLTFACMEALDRISPSDDRHSLPPGEVLFDQATAARHFDDVVAIGCPVVEARGAGWLPGHRYLVFVAHGGGTGIPTRTINAWAECRLTIGPPRVASFVEWLEQWRWGRTMTRPIFRRWGRETWEIPVRRRWAQDPLGYVTACPVVRLPLPADARA